eukprot:scaffold281048_cov22-Tisochrysis_lutea.AAC.3
MVAMPTSSRKSPPTRTCPNARSCPYTQSCSHTQGARAQGCVLACHASSVQMGAKIQCTSCYTAYHPLCARMAGLQMEMVEPPPGVVDAGLQIISYCPKHCRPQPHLSDHFASTAGCNRTCQGCRPFCTDPNTASRSCSCQ